jgi:hypothetical protein
MRCVGRQGDRFSEMLASGIGCFVKDCVVSRTERRVGGQHPRLGSLWRENK